MCQRPSCSTQGGSEFAACCTGVGRKGFVLDHRASRGLGEREFLTFPACERLLVLDAATDVRREEGNRAEEPKDRTAGDHGHIGGTIIELPAFR